MTNKLWIQLSLFVACVSVSLYTAAQGITGTWYSSDSSRIYTVYQKQNGFEAVLSSSSRPEDIKGTIILDLVERKKKNTQYTGIIRSADDKMMTAVKINFADKKGMILTLKLKRMFLFPVRIRWYKKEEAGLTAKPA